MRYLFILFLCAFGVVTAQGQSTITTKEKCTATTVKGVQCKNTAKSPEATCGIHSAAVARCGATTAAKTPCKMRVAITGNKCRHHKDKQ